MSESQTHNTSPEIVLLPINDVKPYWRNARRNDATIEPLKQSIKEYGYRQLIMVDAEHVVILGHARLKALRSLGYQEIHVQVARDLTQEQVRAYRIIDNKIAEKSRWDVEQLTAELRTVDLQNFFVAYPELKLPEINIKMEMPAVDWNDQKNNDPQDHTEKTHQPMSSVPNHAFEQIEQKMNDRFTDVSRQQQERLITHECPECGHEFTVAKG